MNKLKIKVISKLILTIRIRKNYIKDRWVRLKRKVNKSPIIKAKLLIIIVLIKKRDSHKIETKKVIISEWRCFYIYRRDRYYLYNYYI